MTTRTRVRARLPLRRLAAAAATLYERLDDPRFEPDPGADPAAAEARLAAWRETVADGDPERFVRRVQWDGWTPERVRAALGGVRLRAGAPLPGWAAVVGDALRRLHARPASSDELFLPFVEAGRARLADHGSLSPAAMAALEEALLHRLAADFAPALGVERAAFLALHPGAVEARFVERMRRGGLAALLRRLPVLARIAGVRVRHWVAASAELARRLEADRAALEQAFGALGKVTSLRADLSDPHAGGRRVCVLTFASGVRVVYKPRPLALDAAFQSLLARLNRWGAEPPLRVLRVIDRGTYGWCEHVDASSVTDADRFHQRAGMLLCLAWVLGGSDLHAGNLLAAGEHPVLVDLEVMFGAPLETASQDDATLAAAYADWSSVLRTHLLPGWRAGREGGAARREGGLVPHGAAEHRDALLAGFGRMYRLLAYRSAELLAPGGTL
ncbi:MAG TPA: DUF4135 domain-containing protein, partial [Longimicrobiaceae bacterium]|nr:DUF4135 domain-containing protein [Longimicrobiaceae bacterium]